MLRFSPTSCFGVNYGVLRATKSASNIVKDTNLTMSSSWVRAILLRVQDLVRNRPKGQFCENIEKFGKFLDAHFSKYASNFDKKMHFNPDRYCCFGLKKIFH